MWEDKLEDWDWHIHTSIDKIDNKDYHFPLINEFKFHKKKKLITNKNLLKSTGKSTQYFAMAYMGKRWAGWSTSWNQDCWEKYQ